MATPLAKAKGSGASHTGTEHFIKQRVNAIFIIFCLLWLFQITIDIAANPLSLREVIFGSIMSTSMAIFFVGSCLYHGYLGMEVIIQDYINCKFKIRAMLITLKALCIMTFISFSMIGIATIGSFISLTIIGKILQDLG